MKSSGTLSLAFSTSLFEPRYGITSLSEWSNRESIAQWLSEEVVVPFEPSHDEFDELLERRPCVPRKSLEVDPKLPGDSFFASSFLLDLERRLVGLLLASLPACLNSFGIPGEQRLNVYVCCHTEGAFGSNCADMVDRLGGSEFLLGEEDDDR